VPQATVHGEYWLSFGAEWKPLRKRKGAITERKFNRNFGLTGELGLRAAADPYRYKQTYLSGSARYRVSDLWRVGTEYRWTMRTPEKENTGRIDLQSWLRWKKGNVRLDHRFQYERDFLDAGERRTSLRNQLSAEYNIPKWKFDPHGGVEFFTGLWHGAAENIGIRYALGTEFTPGKNKDRSISVEVRLDRQLHTASPEHRWMLVIALEQEFKKK
jgi:hypothetical protein